MKKQKIISIIILVNLIVTTLCNILPYNYSKANDSGYEGVAPEFYGTIVINVNVGDTVDFNNPVFRIFAKDSEDGDLTQLITTKSNNVNTAVAGNYEIIYEVKDSDNHTTEQTVKVNIAASGERTIVRKLYQKEEECQNDYGITSSYIQDRQNLGIYMPAGTNIQMKLLNSIGNEQSLNVSLMNNDHLKEGNATVTGDWTTVTAECDSVPFVSTWKGLQNITVKHETTDEEMICEIDENLIEDEKVIEYANVFNVQGSNKKLKEIKLPNFENSHIFGVWLNTENGDLNSDKFKIVSQENSQSDKIVFDEPIEINSDTFSIKVKATYPTAASFCITASNASDNYTYMYNYSTKEWTNNINFEGGYNNLAPITCNFEQKNELVELKIDDVYMDNSKNTDKVKSLTYFLEGDNENEFFKKWNANNDTYAVLESDKVTFFTPLTDREMLVVKDTPNDNYDFESLKDLFNYYSNLVDMYNGLCGLEYRTKDMKKKNVYAKIFIKPDINGSGLACYSSKYISFHCPEGTTNPYQLGNDEGAHFFRKCWMVYHEIAHGYDEFFREKDIDLSETFNNIFSYYIQEDLMDEEDYWMNIKNEEEKIHEFRNSLPEGFEFNDILTAQDPDDEDHVDQFKVRLYFMVNILNKVGPKQGMQKIFENVRKSVSETIGSTNKISRADILAKSFAEVSGYNVIDYFEYWGIKLSDETKEYINTISNKKLYFLMDKVKDEQEASEILQKLNNNLTSVEKANGIQYEGYYCLVTDENIENCKNNTQGIPSSYDLRNDIDLSVKNQYQNGICAFASAASMWESHVKLKQKNGKYKFYTKTPEFSLLTHFLDVNHEYVPISIDDTKSVIQDYYNDDTYTEDDVLKNVSGFKIGTLQDELYKLTQNLQIVKKIQLPKIFKKYADDGTVTYISSATQKELTNIEVATIRDEVKQHILENGGVRIGMNTAGFNDANITEDGIYTGTEDKATKVSFCKEDGPNHEVLVIGWDDNFAKENFPEDNRPTTDGAYLVLNSWGNNWSDNGVFYISYEDYCVEKYMNGLVSVEEYKDKKMPVINFETNENKIKITCTDNYGTGIKSDSLKYIWTDHNVEPDLNDIKWTSFKNEDEINVDSTKKYLWVIAEDEAGNINLKNNIENTIGEVVIDGIKLDSEPKWVNEDMEIEFMNDDLSVFDYNIWSDTISKDEFANMIKPDKKTDVYTINFNKEGIHTIYLARLKDDGTEYKAQKFIVKLDKTKPTEPVINIDGLNQNEKYAINTNVSIVPGKDKLSGVNHTDIKILNEDGKEVSIEYKNNFSLTTVGKYKINVTTYDNAGNSVTTEKDIEIVNLEDKDDENKDESDENQDKDDENKENDDQNSEDKDNQEENDNKSDLNDDTEKNDKTDNKEDENANNNKENISNQKIPQTGSNAIGISIIIALFLSTGLIGVYFIKIKK